MEQERFKISFYTKSGKCPPVEFIAGIDREARLKVHEYIEMLKVFGNNLRQPYSKKILLIALERMKELKGERI
jgi:hypothetical protein